MRDTAGDLIVVVTGAHMQPEAISVGLQARIGPPAGAFTAQRVAHILNVQARRKPLHNLVSALKNGLAQSLFFYVIEKRGEGQD